MLFALFVYLRELAIFVRFHKFLSWIANKFFPAVYMCCIFEYLVSCFNFSKC